MSAQTCIHSRVRMSLYVRSQLNGQPGFRRQVRMQNVKGVIDRGVLTKAWGSK